MHPLEGYDTRQLGRLVSLLRRGLVTDGDGEELFACLRATFDAVGLVIGQDLDFGAWTRTEGVTEEWKAEHSRLRAEDPAIPRLFPSPAGNWFVIQRDCTEPERHSEIFEAFQRQGMCDAAVAKVYSPFRDDLFIAMYRESRTFDERDTLLLELVYPYLAGGLGTRRALHVLEGESPIHAPAVFVSFPGGEVRADAEARAAITRRIGPVGATTWGRVERAIARAAHRFTLSNTGGRSQVLWPGMRVDFALTRAEKGETLRLVGFLVDEDVDWERDATVPPLVEAVLSPRQLAVARDFVAGMSLSTIAETRRLSRETVRGYLRATYDKLGVRTRTALARALGSA